MLFTKQFYFQFILFFQATLNDSSYKGAGEGLEPRIPKIVAFVAPSDRSEKTQVRSRGPRKDQIWGEHTQGVRPLSMDTQHTTLPARSWDTFSTLPTREHITNCQVPFPLFVLEVLAGAASFLWPVPEYQTPQMKTLIWHKPHGFCTAKTWQALCLCQRKWEHVNAGAGQELFFLQAFWEVGSAMLTLFYMYFPQSIYLLFCVLRQLSSCRTIRHFMAHFQGFSLTKNLITFFCLLCFVSDLCFNLILSGFDFTVSTALGTNTYCPVSSAHGSPPCFVSASLALPQALYITVVCVEAKVDLRLLPHLEFSW